MEPREVVEALGGFAGVSGALICDGSATILAESGTANAGAVAAATAFVLACGTKLGDALALGDVLYVVAGSTQRRVGFIRGPANLVALEASSPAAATRACQEARVVLRER
ncbi:hypothetical protein JXA88_11465 [Candidatus Fermentibacteria bacterium]|nr:hypothetical protein [Candidatus Fermentibacteria bacterium]